MRVTRSSTLPDIGDHWPIRQAAMLEHAREYADDGDMYLIASYRGQVVGVAQIAYNRPRQSYELKTLISVKRHCGRLLLGRSLSIARARGQRLIVFSVPEAMGFYNRLSVLKYRGNNIYAA